MQFISRIGRVGACAIQPTVLEFAAAGLTGIWLANWLQQTQTAFGGSLLVQTAMMVAVGLGLLLGSSLALRSGSRPRWMIFSLPLFLLCAWSAGFDFVLEAAWTLLRSQISTDTWTGTRAQWSACLPSICVCLTLPVAVLTLLLQTSRTAQSWDGVPTPKMLFGLSCGLLFNVFGLAPLWGLQTSSMIAAGLGVLIVAATIWHQRRGANPSTEAPNTTVKNTALAPMKAQWLEPLAYAAVAMGFVAMSRLLDQLAISAWWYGVVKWAGLCSGVAFAGLRASGAMRRVAVMNWIAAGTMLLTLAAFPLLITLELNLNSYASIVWQHALGQSAIVWLAMLPLGLCLGCWARGPLLAPRSFGQWSLCLLAFCGSWIGASSYGLFELGVTGLLGTSASLLVISAVVVLWGQKSEPAMSTSLWSRIAAKPAALLVVGAVAVVALMPLAGRNFDPVKSAKLLFDTQAFSANRIEGRSELLPHFDEGRSLGTLETEQGTLTVWRYRGVQLQLRQSGLPKAVHSLDGRLCPDASAESLPVVLPLVLHERPGHVLALGLRSGVAAETALQFPLQTLTCVESDQRLIAAVRDAVWPQLKSLPTDDERCQVVCAEPLLALAAQPASYDVVISNPDHAMLPQSAAYYTSNFYKLAASALREDGLFCQHLPVVDCGLSAVQSIVAACRSEFTQTAAVEVAPGQWVLLASNSEEGIVRRDLVRRLQRTHVRSVLARLGWDWGSPLELTVISSDRFDEFLAQRPVAANTVANSRVTAALPFEVMRWGDKYGELTQTFAGAAQPLKQVCGAEAETADVARRLTELKLQRELVVDNPDEYWSYRKIVKKRMQEQPQTEILQVKGERPTQQLHANEKRRMEYFEALGAAAKEPVPSTSALQSIAEFAEPFDPLMSFFLHQEVAELAAKNRDANAGIELEHRIHAAYFTTSNDRSVRNIVAAVELICDRPELLADPVQRGDTVDGLVQLLHSRWYSRGDAPPTSSKIALNDIEKSIAAVERAGTVLDETGNARGLTSEQVTARKDALERSLIRPLRNYRQTLMPHHYREQAAKADQSR